MGGRRADPVPNLDAMRKYPLHKRLTQHIVDRDYGGVLMFDPLNIRYATDSAPTCSCGTPTIRFVLCWSAQTVYMVIWDYKNAPFLTGFNPLVREVRSGASMFYFAAGDKIDVKADAFANEVRVLIDRTRQATTNCLAVDKIMLHGAHALEAQGFKLRKTAKSLPKKSRSIKGR